MTHHRPTPPTHRLLALSLVITALWTSMLVPPASSAARIDDFYTPPAPLGAGSPGDLIRSEQMTANGLLAVPLPAKAWRIMYRSTSAAGRPIAVTGTVLVPIAPWRGQGPRPLVGYAVGTQGLADRCAPSRQLAAGTEYESGMIVRMLLRGWAVAVTDYPGLGTPGDHHYVVNKGLGLSVLDAMRAARRLQPAGLDRRGPLGIFGYSEGGGAAAAAIEQQPRYAPDLRLRGAALGAAAADFQKLYEHHDGGPFAFLLLYAAIGHDAAYPGLDLDSLLTDRGRAIARQLRNTCIQEAIALGLLTNKNAATYIKRDVWSIAAWRRAFNDNRLGFLAPATPVQLAASRHDEVFPYEIATGLHERWCARGANVELRTIPTPEHLVAGVTYWPTAMNYLASRFAGEPAPRDRGC